MKCKFANRYLHFALVLVATAILWGNNCAQIQAEEIQNQNIQTDETQEPQQEQSQQLTRKYVIVLDPGHGGADMGANRVFWNIGFVERDINLTLAYYCKEELEKNPNVIVYLTRYDNTSPLLNRQQRVQIAQNVNADAFVSLHINSTGATEQYTESGASVYYPNANYNGMVSSLGLQMSNSILNELAAVGVRNNGALIRNATDGSTYPDGSLSDYLGVNYWTKMAGMPGILIEHAFVNNPNDCANYFMTQEQLRMLAVADAKGIMNSIYSGVLDYQKPGYWAKDQIGWWYGYGEGGYAANTWEYIHGQWYYFDARGYMASGWQKMNGSWYYLGSPEDGAMKSGWQKINNRWYFLGGANDGAMKSGWQYVSGKWYYLGDAEDGAMRYGWQIINNRWYYLGGADDGAMRYDWQKINGKWYYLGAANDGTMAANCWIGRYYVDGSGAWVATR